MWRTTAGIFKCLVSAINKSEGKATDTDLKKRHDYFIIHVALLFFGYENKENIYLKYNKLL